MNEYGPFIFNIFFSSRLGIKPTAPVQKFFRAYARTYIELISCIKLTSLLPPNNFLYSTANRSGFNTPSTLARSILVNLVIKDFWTPQPKNLSYAPAPSPKPVPHSNLLTANLPSLYTLTPFHPRRPSHLFKRNSN